MRPHRLLAPLATCGVTIFACSEGTTAPDLTSPRDCSTVPESCSVDAVQVPLTEIVVDLDAVFDESCAVSEDGQIWCWGAGNATPHVLEFAVPPTRTLTSVSAHHCAVTEVRDAYCWGLNTSGALGQGESGFDLGGTPPAVVEGGLMWMQVWPGVGHACGLTTSGTAYCWGQNDEGQLGSTADDPTCGMNVHGPESCVAFPARVATNLTFSSIVAGQAFSCALASEQAYCWGTGEFGAPPQPIPMLIANSAGLMSPSAGPRHVCALTGQGEAFCWGDNDAGQLGDGTQTDRVEATRVATDIRFVVLSAGDRHTCGVATSNRVHCWGDNNMGQLGRGGLTERLLTPGRVLGLENAAIASVENGDEHACATTMDGRVLCWGANDFGQLGVPGRVRFHP